MKTQGAVMEQADTIIQIPHFYGSLKGMQDKFDKYARQDAFAGSTREEWEAWKETSRETLKDLLGWKYMESCDLDPRVEEVVELENGIRREKVIIQVEPEVYMPMYILIPPKQDEEKQKCFLALPGHQGAGKFSVAGRDDIPAVKRMIEFYHYDYGMQLAKRGYVAICPDCRGFGERRDEALQKGTDEKSFLTSTCFHLAHMAEPLGETVAGMCTWDASRLIDYVYERGEWDTEDLGVMGFSGGGMQTLWVSALDDRVKNVSSADISMDIVTRCYYSTVIAAVIMFPICGNTLIWEILHRSLRRDRWRFSLAGMTI